MRAVGVYRSPETGGASTGTEPGFSLSRGPVGVEAIRDYCNQFHHHLVNTFTHADGDKNYAGLITTVAGPSGKPALILVPDSTHLADDLETLVERLLDLQSTGSEIRCLDPDYPDVLQNGLRLLSLPGRSPNSLRRIREAILAKASRGEVLGRTPYGYWAGLDGQLKVDDREAAIVRRIFDEYAGPPPVGGLSPVGGQGLRKIAAGLNERGLTTRKGRPWTPVAIAGCAAKQGVRGNLHALWRANLRLAPAPGRSNQVQPGPTGPGKPKALTTRLVGGAIPAWWTGPLRAVRSGRVRPDSQEVLEPEERRKGGPDIPVLRMPGRHGAGKRDGRRTCVLEGSRIGGRRPGQIA